MKNAINNITDFQMIVFGQFYALYCFTLRNVSIWTIGISIAFWLIIIFLIFGAKKQEECKAGLHFAGLIFALKWVLYRETAPDILKKFLLINFFLCGTYICTFGLKKIIRERKCTWTK